MRGVECEAPEELEGKMINEKKIKEDEKENTRAAREEEKGAEQRRINMDGDVKRFLAKVTVGLQQTTGLQS